MIRDMERAYLEAQPGYKANAAKDAMHGLIKPKSRKQIYKTQDVKPMNKSNQSISRQSSFRPSPAGQKLDVIKEETTLITEQDEESNVNLAPAVQGNIYEHNFGSIITKANDQEYDFSAVIDKDQELMDGLHENGQRRAKKVADHEMKTRLDNEMFS